MASRLRKPLIALQINGQSIPITGCKVILSSQGSMSTVSAKASLSEYCDAGFDVIQSSQDGDSTIDVYMGFDGSSTHIFSGVLDEFEVGWDEDEIEIRGRDQAAVLADGKNSIANINYKNQTYGQIATQIANLFNFTPNVSDPGIKAGTISNGDSSFNPHPQPWWTILQKMADEVGYECYVTADGTLYFGPEQSQGTMNVNYGSTDTNPENPVNSLRGRYNPRNNTSITVKGVSYDRDKGQMIVASATTSNEKLASVKKGKGAITKAVPASAGGKAPSSNQTVKKIYRFNAQGMTPEAAAAKAQSMASDLAKRQLIISGILDFNPDLKIHTHLSINYGPEQDDIGFQGIDYNVAEVTHDWNMGSTGLKTSFRALGVTS
jgi:prophage tail gpP-like protein